MYRRTGKEILHDNEHIADAVSEEAAELIFQALNNFDHPLIHPGLARPHSESDYEYYTGPVDVPIVFGGYDIPDGQQHSVTRQSDEYACTCGKRWPADEGEDHP